MIFTHDITLDLTFDPIKTIDIKQFTKKSFLLHVTVTNKGEPFYADKSTQHCYFKMVTPDKRHIFTEAIIRDDGTVDIAIPESACLAPGTGKAELLFVEAENPPADDLDDKSRDEATGIRPTDESTNVSAGGILADESLGGYEDNPIDGFIFATMNLRVIIIESAYSNSHITSSDDFDALNKALIAANKTYEEVVKSASTSAENAKQSAENAQTSKNEASQHALLSKSYAVGDTGLKREDESIDENNDNAKYYCKQAQNYYGQTEANAMKAATSETNAANSALLSKSYAVGGTGLQREDENLNENDDNAKHYCKQAESYLDQVKNFTESLSGVLHPMGTVPFASLPALADTRAGAMYNVSDEFITNTNFKEGPGHTIPAGANVYKTADNKWDILAGTPVTGVKGNSENNYRKGNVNITPENIGAPSSEYIAEHFAPDYVTSSNGAPSKKGWYRIAMAKQFGCHSCIISLKRRYNLPSPEYQKVQLMDVYTTKKFVSLAACSGTHFWSKIRYVLDENSSTSYIEIYQDRDTAENVWIITIEDAVGYNGFYMKAIAPVATEETVDGVKVLASMDLPTNFDSDYLAKKDGSNVNGTWSNLIAGKALKDDDGNVIKYTYAMRGFIQDGDFNNIVGNGIYSVKSSLHSPDGSNGEFGLVGASNPSYSGGIWQIAMKENESQLKMRFGHHSGDLVSFSNWKTIYSSGNKETKSEIVNLIYPIGSIYMSVNSTSPATLFGGTWVRWGNGRVPVSVDASQTEFNAAEKTGGSKYLQSHVHTTEDSNYGFTTYKSGGSIARLNVQVVSPGTKMSFTADAGTKDIDYSKKTASAGSGNSENLQPYITCYMWKRTA